MILNEKHHAFIVLSFYKKLTELYGEQGLSCFIQAAQSYGEQRGKRMAARALRDGNRLTFTEYFAYSEWTPTPAFYEISMEAKQGVVEEQVTKCPWAETFAQEHLSSCGLVYCREIDRAIVRGFNPNLTLEITQTCHNTDHCHFFFRDKAITPELLQEQSSLRIISTDVVMPFHYHCGHVWRSFCTTLSNVMGKKLAAVLIADIRAQLAQKFCFEAVDVLESYSDTDFTHIPEVMDVLES